MITTITKHPDTLQTALPEIYLAHLQVDRAEEAVELVESNREHLGVHMGWWLRSFDAERVIEETPLFINDMSNDICLKYRIVEKASDKIVGSTDIFSHDEDNRTAEVAYYLAKDAQGKGYAAAAAKAITQYAFQAWDLKQITAQIREKNIRSQNCIKRLGAVPDQDTYIDTTRSTTDMYRVWRIASAA